jgi:hypothetical protein
MWMTIISFLGGPVIKGLIDAYQLKLKAETTDAKTAADLAAAEIAAQTAETQAQMQYRIAALGHPWEPDKLMGYMVALLLGKLIVWDICLGLGTTDLHGGWLTGTTNTIIGFYFGKRGFENVARIIRK